MFIFETLQFTPFKKISFDRFQMKFILGKRVFIQPAAGKCKSRNFLEISKVFDRRIVTAFSIRFQIQFKLLDKILR